ncbi:MAG TPA: tetratricopeptide repeat protein [Candidatus Limnocylindria bacterium]|nr:tetratricopeptide repeat protein [Candidatus Limnocylindria bacterium]
MATAVVFGVAIAAGALAAVWPFLSAAGTADGSWPAEAPSGSDDIARAVSSLRDLRFAEAAGTIDPADAARLRATLERSAFAREPLTPPAPAPLRTLTIAALVAGIAAILVAQNLPQEAGDRAPGVPITGTVGRSAPTAAELEARVKAAPHDVPTLLALADAYRQSDRTSDAVTTYQTVLGIDRDNVTALNGLALILIQAKQPDGATLAVDRVLALRPKDPDALFLKGLLLYQAQDYAGAVNVWGVYLDVGEFHPAAPMVRSLYADALAKAKAGN